MSTASQTESIGEFSYLAGTTESSLLRNGKVFTRREASGSDSEWVGVEFDKRKMPVHNARYYDGSERHQLDPNGFELLSHRIDELKVDFMNNDSVVRTYYPECENVIREASGADHVVAFDHNVRSVSGNRENHHIAGGQQVQPPLHMVHGDYTLTSAPRRVRDLTKAPSNNDTYKSKLAAGETLLKGPDVERALNDGRFALINVWRNISDEPIAVHPLALCDAVLVNPEDLVVFEIHYSDRIGENYYAKHSDNHKWFYYPKMTRNEALLIKQWDSLGELSRSEGARADSATSTGTSTFSFHSAFNDPSTGLNHPDRWSIEVRCVALFS